MSLSILTNVAAMNTHANLLASSNAVSQAMQRLSSGLRINSAADDAAGYAISQGLTAQVNGLDQAGRNVGDATSMVQTADSALNGIQNMLQRVRELAVQYQNGSNSTTDQTDISNEVTSLYNEMTREVGSVKFNNIGLLNGTSVTFQIGANKSDTMVVAFTDITASVTFAINDISTIDSAIDKISSQAASLGAVQNTLQYTSQSISAAEQNMAASNSQIKDVDMASEMTTLTQQQILQQAGTSMLAQANAAPQMVLKLLG